MSNLLDPITALAIGLGMTPEQTDKDLAEIRREVDVKMVVHDLEDRRKRVEQLAKEQGVTRSTAYKKLQSEKFKNAPDGMSKRDGILEALFRLNVNSGVDPSTLLSALKNMRVQVDMSDMLGRVWDLQKAGFVKFNETHTSHGSELRRIRLTPPGRAEAIRLRGGTPRQHEERVNARSLAVQGFSQSPRMGDHKPVGVDGTDFRNHRKRAQGGPIERIPAPSKAEPEIVPAVPYEPPKPPVIPDPPRQNEKVVPALDLAGFGIRYPYIQELLDRRVEKEAQKVKAAKVVEAASIMSDVDILESEHLLELAAELEGKPFSHLETDVLKLVDRLIDHAGDRRI